MRDRQYLFTITMSSVNWKSLLIKLAFFLLYSHKFDATVDQLLIIFHWITNSRMLMSIALRKYNFHMKNPNQTDKKLGRKQKSVEVNFIELPHSLWAKSSQKDFNFKSSEKHFCVNKQFCCDWEVWTFDRRLLQMKFCIVQKERRKKYKNASISTVKLGYNELGC